MPLKLIMFIVQSIAHSIIYEKVHFGDSYVTNKYHLNNSPQWQNLTKAMGIEVSHIHDRGGSPHRFIQLKAVGSYGLEGLAGLNI